MYYTVYKISNQINGKVYIGCHKTLDLNDGYMGSGKYLKFSQQKNGIENFTKEILFVYDNPKQMYDKERELVDAEFVSEQNTYNLKMGGYGGLVNMKATSYYTSGKHELSIAKARKKAEVTHREKKRQRVNEYEKNPNLCVRCHNALNYDKRKNKYCNSSCSAKHTNTGKVKPLETRKKISEAIKRNRAKVA
jgi:hypothetical protein